MKPAVPGPVTSLGFSFLLLLLVTISSACFIRNCPIGGKRSLEQMTDIPAQRQCLRCGPENLGQCIGPSICCGPLFGCYINTDESSICERENEIPTPCRVEGEMCGHDGNGFCVADSICCNDGGCRLESQCQLEPKRNQINTDTLRYLKALFQRKSYGDRA